MTATQWALLSVALLAGAATPGASLALIISTATKYGRSAGVIQALAHGTGIAFYALLVGTGISSVLFASEHAFQILQLGGCLLLIYLGGKMIMGGWQSRQQTDLGLALDNIDSVVGDSTWAHANKGFLIVFLNPKVAVFFFAVFSQFLQTGQNLLLQWSMASLAGIIDALWYLAMAILVSTPQVSTTLNRFSWQLDILWGSALIAIASTLAFAI